ncbi:MAG: ANTAR domain-containing protein [Bryobacteraceae bacterium]|nr:ANTAR domain-containing protein [Bryobacteraceae bacterium]
MSTLSASEPDTGRLVVEAVAELAESLRANRVDLSLNGRHAAHESEPETLSAPRFLYSRPIAVRGVEYGRLEVELRGTPDGIRPDVVLLSLETAALILAGAAERHRLEADRAKRKAQLKHVTGEVENAKLLARATGIIADLRGVSMEAARHWLAAESARTRRSIAELADRIILYRQSGAPREIAS